MYEEEISLFYLIPSLWFESRDDFNLDSYVINYASLLSGLWILTDLRDAVTAINCEVKLSLKLEEEFCSRSVVDNCERCD